jgi:hypothetical protein
MRAKQDPARSTNRQLHIDNWDAGQVSHGALGTNIDEYRLRFCNRLIGLTRRQPSQSGA